jgi:uncharacterized protein (DUF1697 family)
MATTRYIALLRGINVGGKNPIKMDALRDCLSKAGMQSVSTYIASGNVLFTSDQGLKKTEATLDGALDKAFGYKGPTVIISEKEYRAIIAEAPEGFGSTPDTLHSDVVFLKPPFKASEVLKDVIALKLRDGVDTVATGSKALYFTRVSAERTKSRMNKITELPSYKSMTIRSWNTAKKLAALLDD